MSYVKEYIDDRISTATDKLNDDIANVAGSNYTFTQIGYFRILVIDHNRERTPVIRSSILVRWTNGDHEPMKGDELNG